MERIIRSRRESPEFGWGQPHYIDTGDPKVSLAVGEGASKLEDIFGGADTPEIRKDGIVEFEIDGYGYRWFRVAQEGQDNPSEAR